MVPCFLLPLLSLFQICVAQVRVKLLRSVCCLNLGTFSSFLSVYRKREAIEVA